MMPPNCLRDSIASRMLVAVIAVTLVSCSLSRPSPVKQTYLIQVQPTMQKSAAPRPSTLKIGSIQVASPFRGRSLVYRLSELSYESDFYNEYFVSPGAMITDATAIWLAAAGIFREVLPAGANANGDYVLEGFVSEFYADDRDKSKPMAVIAAKFFLIDNSKLSGVPVWQTELAQRVPMQSRSPEHVAAALSVGLTAMLGDLTAQLAAASLPAR
jgi:cholesterol transport system auxiliary component